MAEVLGKELSPLGERGKGVEKEAPGPREEIMEEMQWDCSIYEATSKMRHG